jgi:hypothetical protein
MNELNKFPESPTLDAVKAYLKAATVQVNKRRNSGWREAGRLGGGDDRRAV